MVKLQAIILAAFLACNFSAERILTTATSACQSCPTPQPCNDLCDTPNKLCSPPPMPKACGPQELCNNVVQGAGNFIAGDINGVYGNQNNVQGYKNDIFGNNNINLGSYSTIVGSQNVAKGNYNQV